MLNVVLAKCFHCFLIYYSFDVDEQYTAALRASETSYYLLKDMEQILPCIGWTPGQVACEVEWIKLDDPERQVFNYNLSEGVFDPGPEFDLASEFSLVIQSANNDNAGNYRCSVGNRSIEVHVIGRCYRY